MERLVETLQCLEAIKANTTDSNQRMAESAIDILSDFLKGYAPEKMQMPMGLALSEITDAIISWYKKNHYKNADYYQVKLTKNGLWECGHTNDNERQSGENGSILLSKQDFRKAINNHKSQKMNNGSCQKYLLNI